MSALQQQIIAQVTHCIQHANTRLQKHFSIPKVTFTQRGKIAGSARLQSWEVRFNPVLLQENPDAFIKHVVPHEIAHLIVFKLFGRVKPHGREWQLIMTQVFNIPAQTTHSFDVSSVQGQIYLYDCQCQEHQLSIRRHNKIQRQQAVYHCRSCKQPLKARQ
ncbi:SprT family zinc-dependent metalloprotease [Photobacterium damselae]